MRVGSLFSGIGLLDLGLTLAGFEHAWFCESDEWRRGILRQRWPGIPVHLDVRGIGAASASDADEPRADAHGAPRGSRRATRERAHGVERVDVIAGGFPCKGASTVGKRTGFDHPETVLWREMARAVRELRPRYVLVENVAAILALHDGAVWGEVLGTLAALGYDTVWDCIPAGAVGAPHRRDRVFCVAADTQGVAERVAHDEADAVAGGREPRALPGERSTEPAADAERRASELRGRTADVASATGTLCAAPRREWQIGPTAADRAQGVEWGAYAPAIRRWEAVHGSAPEPLVRRVDDRGAARVERQRLSALGDGVQVQVGRIAGEYILGLERGRLRA